MKIKKRLMPLLSLCLWVVFTQTACKDTHVVKLSGENKVILNPKNGDVVEFKGFEAKFHSPSPCSEKDKKLPKCTIQIEEKYGIYAYGCPTCKDPEMEVGDVIVVQGGGAAGGASIAAAATVDAWCSGGQTPKVQVEDYDSGTLITTIGPTKTILFESYGGPGKRLETWNVTPIEFCQDTATPINQGHPYCIVKSSAGGDYTYKVYSTTPACAASDDGTVKIR